MDNKPNESQEYWHEQLEQKQLRGEEVQSDLWTSVANETTVLNSILQKLQTDFRLYIKPINNG